MFEYLIIEICNEKIMNLDEMFIFDFFIIMNEEDEKVVSVIKKEFFFIVKVVEVIIEVKK